MEPADAPWAKEWLVGERRVKSTLSCAGPGKRWKPNINRMFLVRQISCSDFVSPGVFQTESCLTRRCLEGHKMLAPLPCSSLLTGGSSAFQQRGEKEPAQNL